MVQILNSGLKTGQKMSVLQSKCPVFEWSGPNHVIRSFENWTKNCPKSQMFRFQMFSSQMITVEHKLSQR